jgi:hypothetical protein
MQPKVIFRTVEIVFRMKLYIPKQKKAVHLPTNSFSVYEKNYYSFTNFILAPVSVVIKYTPDVK